MQTHIIESRESASDATVQSPTYAPAVQALVHAIRYEAEGVISIELRPLVDSSFPPFDAGAHIDLHLPNGLVRSYSLVNPPSEERRYVIGVLLDRTSRGGSRYIHEQLRVGLTLKISRPRNNFKLHEDAGHSVLVAGGIGITPILCMVRRLLEIGRLPDLLYCARSRREAAFIGEIEELGVPVSWHFDNEKGGPPDLKRYLATRPHDAHFYACGPSQMLDAFTRTSEELGHPNVHIERFAGGAAPASPQALFTYEVELRRSGRVIQVSQEKSLLDTLLNAGIHVEHSCTAGICGACETRVLEGEPDHRDSVLSPSEHAAGKSMMVCVSGCKSERLVLDL
jgi:ferredoxin-NADP reductase